MQSHETFLRRALDLALTAEASGEVPVGAVVVADNKIIGEGFNQPITKQDPTAHAEIMAIRQAAEQLGNYRLNHCSLYVTLEPCVMCAGAIVQARLQKVFFGAYDSQAGAILNAFELFSEPSLNHHPEWQGGILANECEKVLKRFFESKR